MLKVKVNTSDVRKLALKYKPEKVTERYSRILSKHLTNISEHLKENIQEVFIKDDTKPKSFPFVKSPFTKIRFVLPKRLKYPRTRTGRLKEAIKVVRGKKTTIRNIKNYKQLYLSLYVTADKKVKYANILNKGGVIRPRKSRFLAVPIDEESFYKSPKEFSGLSVYRRFLVKKVGKRKFKALYMLRKKVEIKPFNYIKAGLLKYKKSNQYKQDLENLEKDLKNIL